MASITFRPEDRLEGSTNFNSWKARLMATLEENDLDDLVINTVEEPTTNAVRATFKKNQAMARRIIYNSVKETLMPVITPLKTTKECFDNLKICTKRKHSVRKES